MKKSREVGVFDFLKNIKKDQYVAVEKKRYNELLDIENKYLKMINENENEYLRLIE